MLTSFTNGPGIEYHLAKSTGYTMTKSEWQKTGSPQKLCLALRKQESSERKLRLVGCACCRRFWDIVPDDSFRAAVESAEMYADNQCSLAELANKKQSAFEANAKVRRVKGNVMRMRFGAASCSVADNIFTKHTLLLTLGFLAEAMAHNVGRRPGNLAKSQEVKEKKSQAAILRDVFGNPFRRVTQAQSWITSTVLGIAQQMYDSRDFSAMPILGDALEDAGCDNTDILKHCRDESQVHVRGCWVCDLVLGKA